MNMKTAVDIKRKSRMIRYYPGCSREIICRCKYFETERIQVTKAFSFSVLSSSFQIVLCLDGYGEIQTMDDEQKSLRYIKGETMFLPAGLGRCLILGEVEILKIRC